jgi:DNA-binding MarR family transcriptional regulator
VAKKVVTPLTDTEAGAWFGLLTVHSAVVRAVEAALVADQGLTLSEYEVLFRLSRKVDGPVPARQLAAGVVTVSPTRVSRVLERLASQGLVERNGHPGDRRIALIQITKKGSQRAAAADDVFFDAVRREYLDPLSARDLADLARIWRKLEAHVAARGS